MAKQKPQPQPEPTPREPRATLDGLVDQWTHDWFMNVGNDLHINRVRDAVADLKRRIAAHS